MTSRQEYRKFLEENFRGFNLKAPLLFNWKYGLRFDLQVGNTDTDEYFQEVEKRANALFEAAFKPDEIIFLVLHEQTSRRGKIRFSNYCFRQIEKLKKEEVLYSQVQRLYEPADKTDIWNIAVIELTTDRLNYRNIISAISVMDFPSRQPRFDNIRFFSNEVIFFLNINRKLIFHMYDDRGLDIVATEKETLLPIYSRFNDWIIEYNREQIDNALK